MKPTYYLKTIAPKTEFDVTRYKIVANFGTHRSYLLGKTFDWYELQDFSQYGTRLVIDAEESYYASPNAQKSFEEQFGVEAKLHLAPGFNMTQNLQSVKVAADPIQSLPRPTAARQIPCATDCGCGPTFTEYERGIESVKAGAIHTVPKKGFWAIVFGE